MYEILMKLIKRRRERALEARSPSLLSFRKLPDPGKVALLPLPRKKENSKYLRPFINCTVDNKKADYEVAIVSAIG